MAKDTSATVLIIYLLCLFNAIIHCFQVLKCGNLLVFVVLYEEEIEYLCVLDCSSDKARNLEMAYLTLENCDRHFSLFLDSLYMKLDIK